MQEDPDVDTFIRWTSSAELLSSSLYYLPTVGNTLPTLPSLVSPIQRTLYSYQDDQLMAQNDKCSAWQKCHAVLWPAHTIWVYKTWDSRSYEANQEREANDMAVFEAIERDLVGKYKHSRWKNSNNSRTSQLNSESKIDRDNQSGANHCRLPYSSFVSDLHKQEESKRHTIRRDTPFDGSLDGRMNSVRMFDDYSARSMDDGVYEQDGSTCKRRDHEIVLWLTFEFEWY